LTPIKGAAGSGTRLPPFNLGAPMRLPDKAVLPPIPLVTQSRAMVTQSRLLIAQSWRMVDTARFKATLSAPVLPAVAGKPGQSKENDRRQR
jgi:hypothetical protein